MTYSGLGPAGPAELTLNQLKRRALSDALRERLRFVQVERIEHDLDREGRRAVPAGPERGRRACELRAAGMTWAEVADALGLPPGARGRDMAAKSAARYRRGAGKVCEGTGEAVSCSSFPAPAPDED